ncbi:MAG: hypothetical protein M0O99_04665 [Desulfuromonas thiophila]|nr:hypothetical protein [Desulfuromonas thiophila]
MSTVRVYKSTDPGAPPHPSRTRGSMAALLRACLVTGWTSGDFTAAPAGWEEPYTETNNYACFRALSGVRQFYQIDDNQSDADCAKLISCDSMSDAQTCIGLHGNHYLGKIYDSASSTEWLVIADERTCYLFLRSKYNLCPQGFGEYRSTLADDPYCAFISGQDSDSSLGTNMGLMTTSKTITVVSTSASRRLIFPGVGSDNTYAVNGTYNCRAIGSEDYPVVPGWIGYGSRVIGNLPGWYWPIAYRPKSHLEEFTVNDRTFLSINVASRGHSTETVYMGQVFIDITGSWE